ncbi:MAG TPA: dihydroorotase [Verrucomicrobiae bacterium]|nr:dihydroorotase [Verrucomicrobiae bacterium]
MFLVKNGLVIDPANGIRQVMDISVKDGLVAEVAEHIEITEGMEVYDATGKIVVPGLIDMHVHLREPGLEAKETIASGTRAAAMGGFTSVACMPNTKPVIDSVALVDAVKAAAARDGIVNVYPIGAITKGSEGQELAEIGDMAQHGVRAISDDGKPVPRAEIMRLGMEYSRMFGVTIISHCEDSSLAQDGVMHLGSVSTLLGLRGIPAAAEEVMVARDIILAEATGARLHIAHVSTKGSLDLIRAAKARGVNVTCEVTPHHLMLTDAAVDGYSTDTKVNPPLRPAEHLTALRAGLREGIIDCIATDHAPHTREEKDVEYAYAPFGLVGLETAVPLIMELVKNGELSLEQAVEALTVKPAGILGLDKGSLGVGKAADITVIDPEMELVLAEADLESKGKNSPFLGKELQGFPVLTMVNGKIVMQDRRIVEKE